MKRLVKFLITAVLLVATAALMPTAAFAEKHVVSDKYAFIGSPSYIFCGSEEIMIIAGDKLHTFSYDYVKTDERDLPGAIKVEKNDNYTVYSTTEGVFTLSEDGSSDRIYGCAADFCLSDDRVYVADGDKVISLSLKTTSSVSYDAVSEVTSLCYAGGAVYFSVKGDRFGYGNVYSVSDDGIALSYDYCKNLSYLIGGETLTYYASGKAVDPENGNSTAFSGDEIRVASKGDAFYYITASGDLYLVENGKTTLIFACTSGDEGFFAFPKATFSDYGKLFVLDYANDRIAVMDNGVSYVKIKRPVAMTADYAGNFYVYGKEGLFKINVNALYSSPEKVEYGGGEITSATYSRGKLYFVIDGKAYYLSDNTPIYVCDAIKVRSEYFGGEMYFLREDGIYRTDYEYPSVTVTGVTDFDVAPDGNFYVLKDDKILKFSPRGENLSSVTVDEYASALSISAVTNDYTDFGDLIITCSSMHKIYNLRPEDAISIPQADLQYTDTDNVIRTALKETFVYENPCSVSVAARVPAGATVITGKYDLYETERMSYVLYEDFSGLKTGYIYKGLLSQPKAESAPEKTTGRTLYDNTALYRFPSARGEKLLTNIGKNVSVTILPFCEYSYDDVEWYKVRYGSAIGFLPKDMLSTGKYVSDDERPQYNAKLTKDAEIYDSVGRVFVPIGTVLSSGTDVEIVGVFDQGSEYTPIKYFDEEKGLCEGYVLTSTLTSYSVTPLQIIGIVCVGIIAVLLIAVCVIKFAGKHRRQLNKK